MVEGTDGRRVICHSRGKKSQGVVGDKVKWQASQDEGTIEKIEPRRNLFYRQDDIRTKSFAANLDLVLVLLAAEPVFSNHQLSRALIAAEAQGISTLIVLNKSDLVEPFARAWERLEPYRAMGYAVQPISFRTAGADELRALQKQLEHQTSLVLGPSGAGKSTLINKFVPGLDILTGELSQALRAGKHTTTSTTWYWIDDSHSSALIDSPGFQEFGLRHIDPMRLARYMPDLSAHADHCRFYNCTHLHEPGCAVIAATQGGSADNPISADRYRIYGELFAELSQSRY
ncbi:MAG TPA: ribosome small subunit-dependent GTPase A [Burkholderiaceae bacterium]|nr:ribosome small subunit-dependent GTPase A [Burkholderiaceae bacterium]HQZ06928.1 ribosome small subunit-dependent GTPase A [Burkholderiaceae bacterium]